MTATLVLLRHGESAFNASDRFAGWLDVPLTPEGRRQARAAGTVLERAGIVPDLVLTSPLQRARVTARLVLDALGLPLRPVVAGALVERHYGALQGRCRAEVAAEVGPAQLQAWRRGWDVKPPRAGSAAGPERGESLQDVSDRLVPWWTATVEPELLDGRRVLVVSHGNTLRAAMRHVEQLEPRVAATREVPIAVPLVYAAPGERASVGRVGLEPTIEGL